MYENPPPFLLLFLGGTTHFPRLFCYEISWISLKLLYRTIVLRNFGRVVNVCTYAIVLMYHSAGEGKTKTLQKTREKELFTLF